MRSVLSRAATLPEAALAFSVGAIARATCPSGGGDLIDQYGAQRVAGYRANHFGDEGGQLR
jgi:hypothetical protein